MTTILIRIATLVTSAALFGNTAYSQRLAGTLGDAAGPNWQSSWLQFQSPISFKKGEKLTLMLQGDAKNVLVRLLPASSQPASADGLEGDVRKVPANHTLVIILGSDHPNVGQISVHAGKEAWGQSLGANNGTIRLVSIERGK